MDMKIAKLNVVTRARVLFATAYRDALIDGGSSLNVLTGEPPMQSGYMVGLEQLQFELDQKSPPEGFVIDEFIEAIADIQEQHPNSLPRLFLGSWEEEGNIHYNLSVWVENEFVAKLLAGAHNQIAIYDVVKSESVYLNDQPVKATPRNTIISMEEGEATCLYNHTHFAHDWAYTTEGDGHMVDIGETGCRGYMEWHCPGFEV